MPMMAAGDAHIGYGYPFKDHIITPVADDDAPFARGQARRATLDSRHSYGDKIDAAPL